MYKLILALNTFFIAKKKKNSRFQFLYLIGQHLYEKQFFYLSEIRGNANNILHD